MYGLLPATTGGFMAQPTNGSMSKDAMIQALASQVRGLVTPGFSTLVTSGASFAAGVMDGALGDRNRLGPVRLVPAIGVGLAIASAMNKDPDISEGLAAIARGFAAPAFYEMGRASAASIFKNAAPPPGAPPPPAKTPIA